MGRDSVISPLLIRHLADEVADSEYSGTPEGMALFYYVAVNRPLQIAAEIGITPRSAPI